MTRGLTRAIRIATGALILAGWPAGVWAEFWRADSETAMAIAGDATFGPGSIVFRNKQSPPLAGAGAIHDFAAEDGTVEAALFRVAAPSDPILSHGNRLCGGPHAPVPVAFIVVWRPAPIGGDVSPRSMAVFSGPGRPTGEAGPGFRGSFGYEAGGHRRNTANVPNWRHNRTR